MKVFDDTLLTAFLDDELSAEERRFVESQLEQNPELQVQLNELRQLRDLVRDLQFPSATTDWTASIMSKVKNVDNRNVDQDSREHHEESSGQRTSSSLSTHPERKNSLLQGGLWIALAASLLFLFSFWNNHSHRSFAVRTESREFPSLKAESGRVSNGEEVARDSSTLTSENKLTSDNKQIDAPDALGDTMRIPSEAKLDEIAMEERKSFSTDLAAKDSIDVLSKPGSMRPSSPQNLPMAPASPSASAASNSDSSNGIVGKSAAENRWYLQASPVDSTYSLQLQTVEGLSAAGAEKSKSMAGRSESLSRDRFRVMETYTFQLAQLPTRESLVKLGFGRELAQAKAGAETVEFADRGVMQREDRRNLKKGTDEPTIIELFVPQNRWPEMEEKLVRQGLLAANGREKEAAHFGLPDSAQATWLERDADKNSTWIRIRLVSPAENGR